MMTLRPLRSLRARLALLAPIALVASACATAPKPEVDLRWPLPPAPARVKFVKAFREDDDLKTSFLTRVFRSLVAARGAAAIDQPTGIALSPDERLLYVVGPTSPILVVDLEAGKIRTFATTSEGRTSSAYGVAVDADGLVYVTDSGANAVRVYGTDGKVVRRIEEKLERPTGIALDRRRQRLYVVSGASRDSQQHRVEVFSLDGKHLRTMGTRGPGAGEFNFPANLGVSPDGALYVVDMLNFRIQVFDAEGRLQGMFGTSGSGPGMFDKAKGVAFDGFGNVYVSDSQLGLVQIFNPKHQVLMAFGGKLERQGYMLLPTALAISSKNTIYVADYAGRCVSEYQLINTAAEDSYKAVTAPAPQPEKAGEVAPSLAR